MRAFLLSLGVIVLSLGQGFSKEPPKYTPEQQEKLKQRDAYEAEANALDKADKFKEAMLVVQKALALEREVFPEGHEEILNSLRWLAHLQDDADDFAEAAKTWTELHSLRVTVSGKDHWRSVEARLAALQSALLAKMSDEKRTHRAEAKKLAAEANRWKAEGKHAEAVEILEKSLRLHKAAVGEKFRDYADNLNTLADLYETQGLYAKAETLYLDTLRIRKEVLGEKHPWYANTLNNLAWLYQTQGFYAKAEPYCLDALRISKQSLGEKHTHYATSLMNLGGLYEDQVQYAKAEPLYLEALRIRKELLGEKHADYAAGLIKLGGLYVAQALYAKAEPLYLEALRIRKEVLGEKHRDYAAGLIKLAGLYEAQDQCAKAEAMLVNAVRILKEVLGEKNARYAEGLIKLGGIYEAQNQYAKAEPFYLDALRLRKEVLGEKHSDYTSSLQKLAGLYQSQGLYAKAEPLLVDALRILKETRGEKHFFYGAALLKLAGLCEAQGLYAKAEPLFLDAMQIIKDTLGEMHPAYAFNLMRLSKLYTAQRLLAKAEPLLIDARRILKEVLGEKHPLYALCLNKLGELYESQWLYAKAEPLYLDARQIRKEISGEKHPEYADSLNKLAELYEAQGLYAKAEPLYLDALRICKEALGEKHIRYADSLNKLAELYQAQGLYDKAEPLYLDARQIRKETLGEKHPEYADSLIKLAGLYMDQGLYDKAEQPCLDALRIRKETLGEKHPDYAGCLHKLASLYAIQSRYDKAEPHFVEAVRVYKETFGEKHPRYAESLASLAHLYQDQGLNAKAEALLIEALRLFKAGAMEHHSGYAFCLCWLAHLYNEQGLNSKAIPLLHEARLFCKGQEATGKRALYTLVVDCLAKVYAAAGKYAEAEANHLEALRVCKEAGQEGHPRYALVVNNLAGFYQFRGMYAKAEPLLVDALQIIKRTFGERHHHYAGILHNLACLYKKQGLYAKAEPLHIQALIIFQDMLEASSVIQSEADQLQHLSMSLVILRHYLNLTVAHTADLYAAVYRWHGIVTARQMFHRATLNASRDINQMVEELCEVTRQLNRLTQNPTAAVPKAELAKQIKALDDRRELLQKKIAGLSKVFGAYQQHLKQTPADLQKSLPEGTALVDFLVHDDWISAFVVTRTSIRRVVLDGGKDLDEELSDEGNGFLAALSLARTKPVPGNGHAAAKLRRRLWEPLEGHLKGITRVLICPDGPLCRLPFAALPGRDPTKYLLEELSLIVVPVPQLLPALLNAEAPKMAPSSLLAVGDVLFEGDPAAGEEKKTLPPTLTRAGDGLSWLPLPHTKEEIEVVAGLFAKPEAVTKLVGKEATEAALERAMTKHRYLHFATHGFFAPPKFVRQASESRSLGNETILLPALPPGLSCGIVCAGANKPTPQSSGILTAAQINELDLRGVELVVLSACETGLGELSRGEGVLGLQRAFQIAGARSTVTTLWTIPDRATAELMKRMYENYLKEGKGAADALREAQLWVLNNGDKVGAFDEAPKGAKRTPPKYWAAFTFAGDWR